MTTTPSASPRTLGFWLAAVDRLIGERLGDTLDEHGVTRRQWQLLNALERGPSELSVLERTIAAFLPRGDEAESTIELLDELVDSGWIAVDEARYALTATGQTMVVRLREIVDAQRREITEGVSESEYAQTVAVLERIARNLGWTDPA